MIKQRTQCDILLQLQQAIRYPTRAQSWHKGICAATKHISTVYKVSTEDRQVHIDKGKQEYTQECLL